MISSGRNGGIGIPVEPSVVLHAHQPVQLMILVVVELRLVEFSDVYTHGRYVAIEERAVGPTNIGTVTGEGAADCVYRFKKDTTVRDPFSSYYFDPILKAVKCYLYK